MSEQYRPSPPLEPAQPSRAQRFTLLTALYAAQGLPYGFFTLALPVLLREAGWSLTAIGLLQFLALPWALKFLWAPWFDHHGTRRGWLLALQTAACVAALVLSQTALTPGSAWLFVVVFAFNLLAATQDIVTDGLAVRMLSPRDRGLANGIQVGAYRLGMILGGGLLLWVLARTSWSMMFLCMAALLGLTILPVFGMKEPPRSAAQLASERPAPRDLMWAWWHRAMSPGLLTFAAVIVAFRFGDQLMSSQFTLFLVDQGVDKSDIAIMKGALGSVASLVGAALGGLMLLRVGRRNALLLGGMAQVLTFCLFLAAAWGLGGMPLLWVATVLEGVSSALATVALYSLMMDASDPDHAGTDYTLLASVNVVVMGLGSLLGGLLGDLLGYLPVFIMGTTMAFLGCLWVIRRLDRHPVHDRVAQAWR
jgi:MFS transporter, PAT family, beta-lactamase induction signal transducer AmpG